MCVAVSNKLEITDLEIIAPVVSPEAEMTICVCKEFDGRKMITNHVCDVLNGERRN